jgi:outer membrane protein assembly factor BamB
MPRKGVNSANRRSLNRSGRLIACFAISVIAATGCTGKHVVGAPWPMLGHDCTHSNRSNVTVDAPASAIKWKFELGRKMAPASEPIIASDGTIYVFFGRVLYAVSSAGALQWSFTADRFSETTPAIGLDGSVYVTTTQELYSLSRNGKKQWRFDFDKPGCGFSSPVVADDGTILVSCRWGALYVLNPDGKLKWRYGSKNVGVFEPAVGRDGVVYAGVRESGSTPCSALDHLCAFDHTGRPIWKIETDGWIIGAPVIAADGTIYVISSWAYRPLYAVDPEGRVKWKFNTAPGHPASVPPTLASDGTIYLGSDNGMLLAIGPDGNLKWQTSGAVPIIDGAGTLYFISSQKLFALNPNGSQKWVADFKYRYMERPVIGANGIIYMIGNDIDGYIHGWHGVSQNVRPISQDVAIIKSYLYALGKPSDH